MTGWVSRCSTGHCIEVAQAGDLPAVWIRTTAPTPSFQVVATAEEWWQFLDGVKAGKFDDVLPRRQQ